MKKRVCLTFMVRVDNYYQGSVAVHFFPLRAAVFLAVFLTAFLATFLAPAFFTAFLATLATFLGATFLGAAFLATALVTFLVMRAIERLESVGRLQTGSWPQTPVLSQGSGWSLVCGSVYLPIVSFKIDYKANPLPYL